MSVFTIVNFLVKYHMTYVMEFALKYSGLSHMSDRARKISTELESIRIYAKTKNLAPGESEEIRISFRISDMASYDDAGVTGHKSAYVLEAGEYPVYVGNSVRSAVKAGSYLVDELRVTQPLKEVAAVPKSSKFKRLKASLGKAGKIKRQKRFTAHIYLAYVICLNSLFQQLA